MKKTLRQVILVMLGGLLINGYAAAQESDPDQIGKATHELTRPGLVATHDTYPFSQKVTVVNAENGKEVEVTIVGRSRSTRTDRIIDLSAQAWEELGLAEDNRVELYRLPSGQANAVAASDPTPESEPIIQPTPLPASEVPASVPRTAAPRLTSRAFAPCCSASALCPAARSASCLPSRSTPCSVYPCSEPAVQLPPSTFNGDVDIVPALPDPRSGKIYRLQVGSFSIPGSADRLVRSIQDAGFIAIQEPYGSLQRVVVMGIPAAEVAVTARKLGTLGIKQVWVRE